MTHPLGILGIPYTVGEAERVARTHEMDIYHKDIVLWLCRRVRKLEGESITNICSECSQNHGHKDYCSKY